MLGRDYTLVKLGVFRCIDKCIWCCIYAKIIYACKQVKPGRAEENERKPDTEYGIIIPWRMFATQETIA